MPPKPPLIVLLLAAVLATWPLPFSQAADKNPWDALEKARSLACRFGPGIATEWKADEPTPEDARFVVEVYVSDIDHQAGRATLMADGAPAAVSAHLYPLSAHFIEMAGMGDLSAITVYPYYLKGTESFPAVWSRHLYLADGPSASQLYGSCTVRE